MIVSGIEPSKVSDIRPVTCDLIGITNSEQRLKRYVLQERIDRQWSPSRVALAVMADLTIVQVNLCRDKSGVGRPCPRLGKDTRGHVQVAAWIPARTTVPRSPGLHVGDLQVRMIVRARQATACSPDDHRWRHMSGR